MAGTPLIELTNVAVDFDGKRRVSGITFSENRGQFIYLTGPTGSGKSLVLKLIAGLLKPSAGEVRIGGDLVNNFTENQKMWMRRSMGIMLPDGVLLRDRSVIDNVMLPALAADESYREARIRARHALQKCRIEDLADLYPAELSSGQRQMACLARAVVNDPVMILADEPAAHLDLTNAQELMNLLGSFSLGTVSVIVASHLQLLPANVSHKTIYLGDGPVTYEDDEDEEGASCGY